MAIKFATNVPQTLCFPYADFMEVNGQYGQQFLYTVEAEGQRDKLYATPTLHDQLQTAGLSPGDEFTITKVEAEGNRKSWLIAPNGNGKHNGSSGIPDDHSRTDETQNISPASSDNGHPPPPDFADMQTLINHCLQTSWSAWNRLEGGEARFSSEDVCKLGISVFIECCRKSILPLPTADAFPTTYASGGEDDLPF
jgi:hypothetical protein